MTKGKSMKIVNKGGAGGFALFIAFWGAVVYFVQNSVGFWGFCLALLKAVVWPAIVLHKVLMLLNVG